MTKTTTNTYHIEYEGIGGLPAPTKAVEAACFQHDEEFTVFKDTNGKAVLSIKSRIIRTIERVKSEHAEVDSSQEA